MPPDDTRLVALLPLLARVFAVTCYCRLADRTRGNDEVTLRLARGSRSVELSFDLFNQMLTPPDVLAAELVRGADAALQSRRGRARMAR